jgi:hypothetical protein
MEAANCWHETPEAQSILEKIDAFERASDRWAGELPEAARAFAEGASEAEDELDDLRSNAVDAAADTYSSDRRSDEWLDAWAAVDEDAPSVRQVVDIARRTGAGDGYLESFAA